MRAVWTGSLSFGLVHMPVRLFGATKDRVRNFKLLDKKDFHPTSYKIVATDVSEILAMLKKSLSEKSIIVQ